MNLETSAANWRKTSRSNTEGNQCVEVAVLCEQQESDR